MGFNRFEGPDFLKRTLFQKFAVPLCTGISVVALGFGFVFCLVIFLVGLFCFERTSTRPSILNMQSFTSGTNYRHCVTPYLMVCAGSSEILLEFSKITVLKEKGLI